jgi:monofunctional biosynthetic peptidoglycan transglycosylase
MLKKWFNIGAIALVSAMLLNISVYFVYPDVSKLKKQAPKKTAFMEYREKEWEKQGKKRKIVHQWVPLSRISPFVVKAVLIAEDDKFWRHEGFDFEAIQKAVQKDIKKKKFKVGGSTVSQQLAKNLYLSPSKNPIRKAKEAILTWRIERNLSKKRIIELYLNVAEWGDGLFGIEAAARHYYGKAASELTAMEAAQLASVLPNPRRFDPAGESKFVTSRSERIYQIMIKRGIVIPEYEELMNEPAENATEGQEEAGESLGQDNQEKPEESLQPNESKGVDKGLPDDETAP